MNSVEQALLSAFEAEDFGIIVAHENVEQDNLEPPYVKLQILQNPKVPWSQSELDAVSGVLQFDIHYPLGLGQFPAKAKRDEIFAAFPIGFEAIYSGQFVTIDSHWSVSRHV